MTIDSFQTHCRKSEIKWTVHGLERLQERDIAIADVKNCIMHGEIIEENPDDFPNPSALIFGKTVSGKIIHVLCGIGI